MEHFIALMHRHPLVFIHLVTALVALLTGAFVMTRPKGTPAHRGLGWIWALAMGSTALASAFIRDYQMPNLAGITPIHAFTLLVAINLPRGIYYARQGRIDAHRRTMRGMFVGGCIVAGLFTLLPGRFLGTLLWTHALGVMA